MAYKLYDQDGALIKIKDLQEKGPWFKLGESFEKVFIEKYGKELGLIINPEKKKNKYAVDLLNTSTNTFGDLKTQHTPFFLAADKYSINPQYAITLNEKAYLKYLKFYDDFEIYFWIDWIATKFEGTLTITVNPMEGIWKIHLEDVKTLVQTALLHNYVQRKYDYRGNNKTSYILDLSNPLFKKII